MENYSFFDLKEVIETCGRKFNFICEGADRIKDLVVGDPSQVERELSKLLENASRCCHHGSIRLLIDETFNEAGWPVICLSVMDSEMKLAEDWYLENTFHLPLCRRNFSVNVL